MFDSFRGSQSSYIMKKLTFTQVRVERAEQFNPNKHPWPRGVMQCSQDNVPIDGSYILLYPCPAMNFFPIYPGDWVTYDSMGNVRGMIHKHEVGTTWTVEDEHA